MAIIRDKFMLLSKGNMLQSRRCCKPDFMVASQAIHLLVGLGEISCIFAVEYVQWHSTEDLLLICLDAIV